VRALTAGHVIFLAQSISIEVLPNLINSIFVTFIKYLKQNVNATKKILIIQHVSICVLLLTDPVIICRLQIFCVTLYAGHASQSSDIQGGLQS
jgi:hypothetical protein